MLRALAGWTVIAGLTAAFAPPADAQTNDRIIPAAAAIEDAKSPPPATSAPAEPPAPITATPEETAAAASTVASVAISPPITLVLKADLGEQRLTVLEGDTVLHVWPISSGTQGYATPTGVFQPQWASKLWYSRQYEWAPMPHAVFFSRGVAFHGTNATWRLGKSASHGCVRLAPANAAQLFALVYKHGFAKTRVIVYGTPKHDAPPAVAQRRAPPRAPAYASTPPKKSNGLPDWAMSALFR